MTDVRAIERLADVKAAVARSKLLEKSSAREKSISRQTVDAGTGSRYVGTGLVIAFAVGTGGLPTKDYVTLRNDRGYKFSEFQFKASDGSVSRNLVRSAVEALTRVREAFKPSVTELASIFGVSRQAIYNWQAGQSVGQQNQGRLEDLAKAADLLVGAGITGELRPLNRRLPGGKSLLEIVRDGGSPTVAVRTLLSMLEKERQQRESLAQHLSPRARVPVDLQGIGSPHLDESA